MSTSLVKNRRQWQDEGTVQANVPFLASGETAALSAVDRAGVQVDARGFGVVGDGATDNATALETLRTFLQANRDRHVVANFPYGSYLYSRNRWLYGAASVALNCNGSTFTCTSASASEIDARPFNTHSVWMDYAADSDWNTGLAYHTGYLISTVAAGAAGVTCITASQAGNFAVGMRALVYGFDQNMQSSFPFPPMPRFFQLVTIKSFDAGTGALTFYEALRYDFRSDWRNTSNGGSGQQQLIFGAARIMSLERTNFYYPRLIKISDAKFLKNPNWSADAGLVLSAEVLVLENVEWDYEVSGTQRAYTWQSENMLWIARRCRFAYNECDVLVGSVLSLDGTRWKKLSNYGGAQRVLIEDNTLYCQPVVSPKALTFQRNTLFVPAGSTYGLVLKTSFPTERAVIQDNEVIHDGNLQGFVDNGDISSQAISVASVGSSNEIQIPDNNNGRTNVINRLAVGTPIWLDDMSKHGRVLSILYDSATPQWKIGHNLPTAPVVSETYRFNPVERVEVSGTRFQGGQRAQLRNARATQLAPARGQSLVIRRSAGLPFVYGQDVEDVDVLGYVSRITVQVLKPYTGSNSTPYLSIFCVKQNITPVNLIDLTVRQIVGTTYATTTATPTLTGSAALTQLTANVLERKLQLIFRKSGGTALTGSEADMPVVSIEIEVTPIGG